MANDPELRAIAGRVPANGWKFVPLPKQDDSGGRERFDKCASAFAIGDDSEEYLRGDDAVLFVGGDRSEVVL